jgi:2-iminobutanoate/2-iminopropanoate deaminase
MSLRTPAGSIAIGCALLSSSVVIPQVATPLRDAVQAGEFLFLSGQSGSVPNGQDPHGSGFDAAARNALDKLGAALASHGASFDHVVKCTVMLADIQDWPRFNLIYRQYFKPDRLPARSAMGGLALPHGAPLEIECTAYVTQPGK